MAVGTQGRYVRLPIEALKREEALLLYVNLNRWNPGSYLQKLSLADVPPLGSACP